MSRKSRWIKRIVIIVAVTASVAWTAMSLGPAPVSVETATVTEGPLVMTVSGTGKTRMRDKQTVFAPATGDISRITLRPGDTVAAGDIIAGIEPGIAQPLDARSRAEIAARLAAAKASLAEAKRNVERARIAADLAKREEDRIRYLVENKAMPTQRLETAEAEEETRTSELALAELAVERARLEAKAISVTLQKKPDAKERKGVSQTVAVTAPASGVVLRVHTESAGPVQTGAPLIDIGDPSTAELVIDLPTQSAMKVAPGDKVTVDGMGNDKTLAGTVRLVEPAAFTKVTALGVEEQRVNVIVSLKDVFAGLGDGFAADAHIEVERTDDVTKVSSGAVFREGTGFAVFAVEGKRCRQVPVEVKHRNADEVHIAGLTLGARVVVHPSDKLKDGALVTVE